MEYKLIITDEAYHDLDCIVEYIVKTLKNSYAASSLLDKIEKHFTYVKDNPYMYQKFSNNNYRKIVIDNYIMVYKISESDKIVYILRIFYGYRNYFNLL